MALHDPYQTLGVSKTATDAEIRRAFHALAKRHHPDVNAGDKEAEERFKHISAANELLSDPEKRARFDRGEIDALGQERRPGARTRQGSQTAADFSDVFGDFFSTAQARGGAGVHMRGRDQQYVLSVGLLDAVNGTTQRLALPDGRSLEVKVPAGIEHGQVLRLKGQGASGLSGVRPGDALIEIRVLEHPYFRREGDDLHVDIPVSLSEAVLGGRIEVPTRTGNVALAIPPRSDSGTRMRLRGKGVPAHGGRPAGDQYVTLRVVVGPADEALERFLGEWQPGRAFNPRKGMLDEG
jgi:DnaJ-class molecular chaperone